MAIEHKKQSFSTTIKSNNKKDNAVSFAAKFKKLNDNANSFIQDAKYEYLILSINKTRTEILASYIDQNKDITENIITILVPDMIISDNVQIGSIISAHMVSNLSSVGIISRVNVTNVTLIKKKVDNALLKSYKFPEVLFDKNTEMVKDGDLISILTYLTNPKTLHRSEVWLGKPNASCVYFVTPETITNSFSSWFNGENATENANNVISELTPHIGKTILITNCRIRMKNKDAFANATSFTGIYTLNCHEDKIFISDLLSGVQSLCILPE